MIHNKEELLEMNIETLNDFRSLKPNWNDYDGLPFSDELINKCIEILHNISQQPQVFPTGRGTIQYEYEKQNGDYLEFEIYHNKVSVYQVINNKEEEFDISTYENHHIILMNELVNKFNT